MNVKKYLSAVLMCALIILQILPATFAAADFVSLKWISPSSTDPQEIFNGQSAVFRVQIIAPGPITPSIQLYDTTKGSVVKTFSGGTFTTPKFYEAEFTIDNSIYGAGDFPKKYSVVVGGTYKDAKGKTYDIPAERIYLSVNKKPLRFSSNIPDITLNEDARYTTSPLTYYFDYDEGDYEKLSFSSSDVQDISVSMVGNRATLTPRENFNGARSISFILTNGETTVYSNTAKITVNPINDAPVITTSSLPKATVGNPYSQKIEANDIEGDSLTFSLIDSPVGMSIGSSNGVISWTPSAAGNYNIKIKVTDNGKNPDALSTEKAFTIEAVEPDNKSPVINSFTVDSTSKLGESDFTFTVSANDPDGDSSRLKYEFDADGKAGYEIDNANSNVLTRKFSKGDYTIGVRVTDIRGGTATASLQITASNNAPTIKSSTPSGSKVTITEKSTQEFSVIAEDKDVNDKDKLAYSWKLNGKEVSTSQSYKLETDYNSAGDYTLDVTVSDGTARAVKSWEVHVTDMNQIPLILEYNPSASKVTINEGESKIFSVYEARDLDGDALSYKWNLNGKQLPASENSYTFSADYKSAGDYSLSVAVSDGKSDSVPVSWEIYVNDVNTAPSIVLSGYTSITDEQELLLIVSSSDAEGDEIRFKEPKTLITGYTFTDLSTTQKLFKWRPLKGTGGTFPIRFEADDGKAIGFTDANIIVTTVTPKNNPPIADFTFSPASPKVNEVVTFTSTSKDNDAGDFISSYAWDFNSDGKTDASTQIATYKFAAEGTYNAKLNVTDSKGASSSTIKSVTVIKTPITNNPPVADFTFSPLSPKTGDVVSFTSKASDPDGDSITHSWDFNNDGTVDSVSVNPTYTYNAEGTYNAKLNVTDSKGASSSTIKSVTVIKTPIANNPPIADFTFSPASPKVNEVVTFTSTSYDNDAGDFISSYAWDFDSDGKTDASTQIATYKFAAEGTYNAKLNVTDSKGASSSTIKSVTVIKTLTTNNPPVADFTFSPLSPKTGDAVSFTSKASDPDGDAITHAWDFNSDGIIDSTLTAPTYTYNAEGTYNAKLNVTDSKGASSSTIKSITVIKTPTTNNPPVADFTFSPATPSVNEQVQFDGSPSSDADNDALSYSWIFESGKTSNEVKPKYAFTKDGSYDVNLTVAETNTADKKSNSIVKRVTVRRIDVANTNPIADFSFSPANPKVGDTVSFISTSKDNDAGDYIREYNWDTNGDGGTDSTISTASMIFTTAGTYNARLTVVDSRGASNSVVKQVVVSSYQNNPPIADFSFSPANPKVGDTVSFISTSRDNDPADYIIHFSWDLNNDGIQDANLPTASYTYSSAGTFNAKLTVTDSHGAINSVVRQVVVSSGTPSPNNPPVADFTYIPANPASGQEVTFTSTSTDTDGDSVSVKWDLNNDGVIDSTSNIVKYTFSAQGTYPIKLTATDSKSASSSVTKSIVVGPKPKLEITSLNCFDVVVKDAKQSCSAEVKAGGQLVGDASVKIYFSDGSSFGQCNSDSITGACRVSDKVMTQLGSYTVYATAEKAGHDSDLDKQPTFLFRVIKHRYDIISLQLYSDQNFISEDYDYFRGENLYARFKVKDLTTNQFVNNGIVTEVALVSRPGGNVSLTDMGIAGDFYRYKLTPIPLTHGFKGESQVFTFAFNFADDSGGEKDVQLVIRNNPPKINGNIPDVTCSVGKTCELPLSEFDYNSDKEDSGDNLKWAVSGVNTNLFDAVIDGKSLKITGKDKGNDEVTLTLYDLDRDSDSDNINVEITKPVLEITKLRCFENVIVNENQSCSVFVKADNQPIGNTDVSLYFSDGTSFGQCKTDRISGGCEAQRTMLSVGNNYEVYAVADKSGYDSDDDKQPRFAFRVLKHRYDIENLKVFNDAGFAQEDYDFFRGENLYAQFRVKDLTTGNYVTNVITRATLVSEPGGREDLSKYGMNGEFYRYSLTPIPLTHEFKGDSQVFTFAFNFADSSGGQKEVNLVIRNNPPEIRGEILFECMLGTVCLKNLDVNEFDREDRGINLTWTLKSYDSNIISAKLDGKMLIVKPLNHGTANLLLALTDLDNDTVSKVGTITVSNRGVVLEPIGSKFVSEGQTLQFVVAASDNDNDVIKLSAASLPKGAEFDTVSRAGNVKQIFTWTPSFAQSGTYVVRFQATDGVSIVYEDVTIKVGEQSLKPIFSSTPITQIEWGKDYVYDANAYDPDGVVVKYQLMQAPNGMLINQFTGVVTWQPTFKDIGSHQVVIQAVDDSGLTAEQDYVLTVISEPGSLRKKLDVGDISFPKNLASYGSGDLLPVEITFTNDGKVPLTTTAATIALYDSYQDLVSSPKRVLLSIPAGKTVTKRVYIELPDELDSDAEYYLRVTSTDINSGGSFSNPLYFSK